MSLPAISSAAYAFSTNQSAVQVTYADASTAIVYPNEFLDPRTQQLNEWIRAGGQIAPYVPPPAPLPSAPSYLSLVANGSSQLFSSAGDILWSTSAALNLNLNSDNASIDLKGGRAYQVEIGLFGSVYSNATGGSARVGMVKASDNSSLVSGGDCFITPTTSTSASSGTPAVSYIYVPTQDITVKVRVKSVSGQLNLGNLGTVWAITEVLDETVYAEKVGPRGPQGVAGPTGPQGPAGPTGPQGGQGPAGPTGAAGPTGPQGAPGPGFLFLGDVPNTGSLPSSGNAQGDAYLVQANSNLYIWSGTAWVDAGDIQGPQGIVGPQGPAGPQGAQGPAGPVGPAGPTGATGAQGPVGPAGPTGATGAQGAVGPAGPVGPQGATGPAGPAGPVGPAGPQANVYAYTWSGNLGSNPSAVGTAFSYTLPTTATAYQVTAVLWFDLDNNSGYGAYATSVNVTNSTTGYNATFVGSTTSYKVIDYMNYPVSGTVVGGASGLASSGALNFNFNYQGSFSSASVASARYQVTITYW